MTATRVGAAVEAERAAAVVGEVAEEAVAVVEATAAAAGDW